MKESILYIPPILNILALFRLLFKQVVIRKESYKKILLKLFLIIFLGFVLALSAIDLQIILLLELLFILYFILSKEKKFQNFSIFILVYYINVFLIQTKFNFLTITSSIISINIISLINYSISNMEKNEKYLENDKLINLIFNLFFIERVIVSDNEFNLSHVFLILISFMSGYFLKRFLLIDDVKKVSISLLVLIIGAIL